MTDYILIIIALGALAGILLIYLKYRKSVSVIQENDQDITDLKSNIQNLEQDKEELLEANDELTESNQKMIALVQDLEETQDKLERALNAAEESDKLKSEFLSNTSHELRTPLNSIIGFLKLITDGMCDSEDEQNEFISNALESAEILMHLINDILDIAQIETGGVELELDKCNLEQIMDSVLPGMIADASKKNLDIEFKNNAGDVEVWASSDKLKQILLNLLGNAIKFTSWGKVSIDISIPEEQPEFVKVKIDDTGVGVPANRQNKIFDIFTQGDGSTSRQYGGAGLGLSIAKSYVELMGGEIGLSSPGIGKGTTVYFTLRYIKDDTESELKIESVDQLSNQTNE